MDKALFNRVVALLEPLMNDPMARKALIETALLGCAVLPQIEWTGSSQVFTTNLILKLENFGDCTPGQSALVLVLKQAKEYTGLNHHALIDELMGRLTQPTITIDNYTLDEMIDEGGNGQVWRAREHMPDGQVQLVAIKLLKASISADPRRVERFKKEISAARRLNHPHILRALDYGLHQDQFYVVMDFIAGKSLRHQLTGKPLPTELAIGWLGQMASALSEAHAHNIIHRDIKPENILYQRKGETDHLYLTDFGLVYSSDIEQNITEEGDLVGTGRYMSPEQCNPDHGEVSVRSDVYALGIMAYEMLTGTLPFQGTNKVILCQHHLVTPLPAHSALTASLYRILERATAKRPDERYASVQAFMDDLQRWQDDPANLEPVILAYLTTLERGLRDKALDRFVELSGDEQTLRARLETTLIQNPLEGFADYDDFFKAICAPVEADHVHGEIQQRDYVPNVRERLMSLERAVLVGEPGAGKTWMMYGVTLAYCRQYKQNPAQSLIPILVPLNSYQGQKPFDEFVRERAGGLGVHLDRLLRQSRVALLCDALNEMPKAYLDAVREYLTPIKHFIVSCRVRDYQDELQALNPLEQVILRDMDLDAIHQFIHLRLGEFRGAALWQAMGGSEALFEFWRQVNEKGEAMGFWEAQTDVPSYTTGDQDAAWRAMHSGARLIPLARSPFTAQMICGIYEAEGALEQNRAALFSRFVSSLLRREQSNAVRRGLDFPNLSAIETALVSLAQLLQSRQQTVISQAEALAAIEDSEAETLLKAATDANLLMMDGDNIRFAHQLLQEYFAVRILAAALDAGESPERFFGYEWWEAGAWRETVVILGEFLGDGTQGPNRVMRWLASVTPELALSVLSRHGAGYTLAQIDSETKTALIAGAKARAGEIHPLGRAAAYRVLGLFNADDRPGIGLCADGLPDIEWIPIPDDGEWTYQEEKHPGLPAFQMSKYPVTYAQYQAFIDAPEGFRDARWWEGLADDEDRRRNQAKPGEQVFKYSNHPRERVSWYDAMAFCRWLSWWLSGRREVPDLDDIDKWVVRLPTEREWEKAARGTEGRQYPYGNTFDAANGNTDETGIGRTSAVGIFPQGASPYGVEEMSGNVWEWCLTDYHDPASTAGEENVRSNSTHVVRGGSWNLIGDSAHAVSRYSNLPNARSNNLGFRVVRTRR